MPYFMPTAKISNDQSFNADAPAYHPGKFKKDAGSHTPASMPQTAQVQQI
jgi:hypothetical protein